VSLSLSLVMAVLLAVWPVAEIFNNAPRSAAAILFVLSLGLAGSAILASLKGRGVGERLAFYAWLILACETLGQAITFVTASTWPPWPLMVLVVGAVAVAEPPRIVLATACLASVFIWAGLLHQPTPDWLQAAAASVGLLGLAGAVDLALRGEKRRLSTTLAELARLKFGVDHLESPEALPSGATFNTAALTLRQISEDGRRARQVERVGQLHESLTRLVALARQSLSAHSVLYFEIDRPRELAYLRTSAGPDAIVADSTVSLRQDPFAFLLDRDRPFYATDYSRLLWALPYYRGEVRIGTLVAMPVRVAGVTCGALVADRLEMQAFAGEPTHMLESFADMAGEMVREARAALSREELGAEFKAAYEVSRKLATLRDAAPVRHMLLRSARDLVALDAAAVVTTDDAQTRYVIDDASGWAREFVGREVGLTERTWTAWVVRSAEEPYLLDDSERGRERMPVFALDEGMGRAPSLLAVPLRVRDRTLGALVLTAPHASFDAATRRVLGILANQAAAALHTMRLMERAKGQALRDGLTDLYNRRAFDDLLARTLAREQRQEGRLGLVLVDLDHFKKLNDTYGHPAGDAALKAAAQTLERHLRKGDHAARYGGEEFVAILPGADEPGAARIAERVRKAIEHHRLVFEGARLHVTASMGVAVAPMDGDSAEALLAAADRALYAAKHQGRNRVVAASSVPPDDQASTAEDEAAATS
jgi:diguanylate cyclase (GGDEF)-like protein